MNTSNVGFSLEHSATPPLSLIAPSAVEQSDLNAWICVSITAQLTGPDASKVSSRTSACAGIVNPHQSLSPAGDTLPPTSLPAPAVIGNGPFACAQALF